MAKKIAAFKPEKYDSYFYQSTSGITFLSSQFSNSMYASFIMAAGVAKGNAMASSTALTSVILSWLLFSQAFVNSNPSMPASIKKYKK